MNKHYFYIFRQVIFALFIRELKTRFGENKLGFIWVIFEPLAHIVAMLVIFSFMSKHMMPQVPFVLFLMTGMIPFFLFRSIVTALLNSIDANKALFTYRPVKPFDTYVARTLLEVIIYTSIFGIVLVAMGWFFDFDITIQNPFELILEYILIIVLGFSFGILSSIVGFHFPFMKMVIKIVLMILYFISAVMYPIWIIPAIYKDFLLFNPILHVIEMFRESFFSHYPHVDGINTVFPLFTSIFVLFIGLALYRRYKLQLASSL